MWNGRTSDINDGNEEQQVEVVREAWAAVGYIPNPSEAVQLAAVRTNGMAIKIIRLNIERDPSELVQLEAVKQNPNAIYYIERPSEQIKLEALKGNPALAGYIEDHDRKVLAAQLAKPALGEHSGRIVTASPKEGLAK